MSKHLLSNIHSLAAESSSAVSGVAVLHVLLLTYLARYRSIPQAESMQRYGGLLHSWLRPHFLDPAFLNHAVVRWAPAHLSQQATLEPLRPWHSLQYAHCTSSQAEKMQNLRASLHCCSVRQGSLYVSVPTN